MRVSACIVRAVATKEILACRNAMVSHVVGQVAIPSSWAGAGFEVVAADGNLIWVVCEVALRTERAGTWAMC